MGCAVNKKRFEDACKELEAQGYGIQEYRPQEKYAAYHHPNGSVKEIGRRKK
jgi:hypothetical protein